jgi:hypothetical protein
MGGIQPLLTIQESGRTQRMHEMIEFLRTLWIDIT